MKTFVKENWYKLMVGTSMLMVSFGFMIYAVSPAYSNSNSDKTEIKNTNTPVGSNGVIVGDKAYFVDGGYMYICPTDELRMFCYQSEDEKPYHFWSQNKWMSKYNDNSKPQEKGGKYKLP